MKKLIHENTLNIYTEDHELIDSIQDTSYVISPNEGMLLKNKKTGFTTDSVIGVGSKESINDYIEIEKGASK